MKLSAWFTPFLAAQVLATAIPTENIENANQSDKGNYAICNRKYHYGISRNKFRICGSKDWGNNGADVLREIDHKRIHIHKIENGNGDGIHKVEKGHGDGCDWWVRFQASAHWLDKYFEHAIRDAGGPSDVECKEVKYWP
ncbi:hypothetical protein AC578_7651 [Pseudocercospora eumusae]|uniref:Ecp2 effector protein domain-containing protein n=1 Tax=Pseudocercospora eumusae TaxID=321146 RepID=A0A139H602_9PEZI|nr:hypothetical protein AC578_7651 [Pseudocercospora eumusae]